MLRDPSNARASRRRVLSSVAAAGLSPLLAEVASDPADARPPTGESKTAESKTAESTIFPGDALSLGTFESGLDGWEADDAVGLSRVARSDRPVAVTEGEYALDVSVGGESVDGESAPAIARPVSSLDLAARPHFLADVAPGRAEETDSRVAFQFRLYRPDDSLDGGAEPELVAESDPVTVRQTAPGRVFWDASDADPDLLDAVSRLELAWYPADHPPGDSTDSDPDSEATGGYTGAVVVDDVRACSSVTPVGSARLAKTFRELQFDHGAYERTEVSSESAHSEEGDLVFADGATEPYRFEKLGDDRFRFALGGTAVKLGGGWS